MGSDSYIRCIITIIFVIFFSYFSHRAAHDIYPYNIFHMIHHNDEYNNKKWALLLELIINLFQIGGLILIPFNMYLEKLIGIKLLNNYVILYYSLVYTSHHMINYHYIPNTIHIQHHKNEITNYGPDIIDVLFFTKEDNTKFEYYKFSRINCIISGIIVILLILIS